MTLRPLYDQIVVKPVPKAERIGRVWVPDEAKEPSQEGDVLAVGSGTLSKSGERIPLTVKPGDRILFAKHWEKEVEYGGEKVVMVHEKDVIGMVDAGHTCFTPLYNTVSIEADPLPEKAGSLWLPMQVKRPLMPAMTGKVVQAGPGHRMQDGAIRPLGVRESERVLFEAYAGEDHEVGGRKLRLIPEEHVLAVMEAV